MDFSKGGVVVYNGSELSFIVHVKVKKCLDSMLVELKEAILKTP